MNDDLTDEQRARALDLHRLYHRTLMGVAPETELDPRVGLPEGACLREGVALTRSDAASLLPAADASTPTSP